MKHSFKSIVKESIREAFYNTPKKDIINEELFGKKLYVLIKDKWGEKLKLQSLISKNTNHAHTYSTGYREKEYRISWFNRDRTEARGHFDFDKRTLNYILKTKQLPPAIKKLFSYLFHCKSSNINLEFVDKFDSPTQFANEELFLMEESVRELESFIENKRPA